MSLNPCINLSFNGQCEAAFKFYERHLNGKITYMLTWGDSPMAQNAPPKWSGKIAHATLQVGNTRLQGSDPAPGSYEAPKGFGITLNPEESEAAALFAALAEGGRVGMPLQQTFWSPSFGVVTDRFGIPWIINCEKSE
jgi:PhnB protein